ncbi:sigma-70 family RNA polymerase sigma factor [Exilibacterium tricleocarpae]|uniref:Sigma-70 family RNA polymerase sigma factor n=1 Tax=Exilibacterium tricleocarpae TaxID=2591008 RepID=A0A545T0J4_9GAMM|nr:RNA polymerase sigma factor SigJ [Exilibacterium tricleocarpae]TQV70743.1 sigma-70 family RNA polymerase sigma factor [Exilibacterium tricleocarpae]
MVDANDTQRFEQARPHLLGLAYRILGSRADAEDAVQDTFLKWANTDRTLVENTRAWLTTTCTRRCLDLLRATHRARVNYVGSWLPEPIHTAIDNEAEAKLDLAGSLTTGFLLMLERLTPKERAAYLLHEVFDHPYVEVAATLEIQEAACRKLVSRARTRIGRDQARHLTPLVRQSELLAAFEVAITEGSTGRLSAMLASDVQLTADGGGKVAAIRDSIHGKTGVMAFVSQRLRNYWADLQWQWIDINGARGAVLKRDEAVTAVISFAYDPVGQVTAIYIVRNPDKLARLDAVAIH